MFLMITVDFASKKKKEENDLKIFSLFFISASLKEEGIICEEKKK